MSVEKQPSLQPNEYFDLVQRLVTEGECHGKTASVAAFQFKNFELETLTQTGLSEVVKEVNVDPLYLVMDLDQYPDEEAQKALIDKLMDGYGDKFFANGQGVDLSQSGFWLVKESSFKEDYKPDVTREGVYNPDPEAYRVCLNVDDVIGLPTTWDTSFAVEAGGTVAIRAKDVPALVEILDGIKSGDIYSTNALLNADGTSRFDIYGMEPGFLDKNYAPTELAEVIADIKDGYVPFQQSEVSSDPYKNSKSLDYRADQLGIGICTYPVSLITGKISPDCEGIPGQESESILGSTGRLRTFVQTSYQRYGSAEYALLSHDNETDKYFVREYALWLQPTADFHEDHMLHVLKEKSFDSFEDAERALGHIDEALSHRRSVIMDKYHPNLTIEAEEQADLVIRTGEGLDDMKKRENIGFADRIRSIWEKSVSYSRDDLIEQVMDKTALYVGGSFKHAGLDIGDTPLQVKGITATVA